MNRRQFLFGTGGAVLAIPFLPSLVKRGRSAVPEYSPHKCFFATTTQHGGVWAGNMYPDASILQQETVFAGRPVRYGALDTGVTDADGRMALSNTCRAAALTPSLASKFNILRGVDIPYRISHHAGGYLGNFAQTTGLIFNGVDSGHATTASLDQFIAWSPSFYSQNDLQSRMTQRSFNVASGEISWNFASPATRTGAVVQQPAYNSNEALFRLFFDPGSTYNGVDGFIIDRVKESYSMLRKNPRLTYGDRMRLDQHVERMFEIERKLSVAKQLTAIPEPPTVATPTPHGHGFSDNGDAQRGYVGLLNDIIVAAFSTGVSRVGTFPCQLRFTDQLFSDWHGEVAHGGLGPQPSQDWTVHFNQQSFEHVMVDLAAKMDAVDMGNGSSLLDNSLLMFAQEAGQQTHHSGSMAYPVVTAGGAGGYFNTGMYVDFRNTEVQYDDLATLATDNPLVELESPGLYYNQFLATVLQSMGIPPSEFEIFTDFGSGEPTPGYGIHHVDASRAADYALAKSVMSVPLPVITNA